jgi:hypothetical protein
MKKLFTEGFTAVDIAEPLISFDAERDASETRQFMLDNGLSVVGIRREGIVAGYVETEYLTDATCGDAMHGFDPDEVMSEQASYRDVITCLDKSTYCFISDLGAVGAVITRNDIQKPSVRMWLFGMISIVEMYFSRLLEQKYETKNWQKELPAGRLAKAETLQAERKRRGQDVKLISCLHLSDKAHILMKDPDFRDEAGFESKRAAQKAVSAFESLRNSLAHAHDIVTHDWEMIVRAAERLDKVMTRI